MSIEVQQQDHKDSVTDKHLKPKESGGAGSSLTEQDLIQLVA